MKRILFVAALVGLLGIIESQIAAAAESPFHIQQAQGRLTIMCDGQAIACYVYQDEQTPRPYFKDLKTLAGKQVTRNHPPKAGVDADDHFLLHPGIWLAFGDVNGHDSWRLKSKVVHERFLEEPRAEAQSATYTVVNRYETSSGENLMSEECRYKFVRREDGWLLIWDSKFLADSCEIVFGDQEEMGLGVRLATPLAVKNGGEILNSNGQKNEKGCWGKAADWCDYGGKLDQSRCGILILGHPENVKKSSFHARDYGFIAANPFAEKAFGRSPEPAKTVVPSGDSLRLRFGIVVYGRKDGQPIDAKCELAHYLKAAK